MSKKSQFLILALAVTLTACASTKIANNDAMTQQAVKEAAKSDISPDEATLAAAKRISDANDAGLRFFAPLHMAQAKDKLKLAQKLKKKIKLPEDKLAVISAAFAVGLLIEDAYKNKIVVEQQLSKSLAHKAVLEELGTPTVLPKAFNKGVKKILGLIKEIEAGGLNKAIENEAGVLKYLSSIEADTLKKQYLKRAESMLKKAKSADAGDFAEKSLEQAVAKIKLANAFIKSNYRDREGVKKICNEAFNAAARAYFVAIEASKIVALKEKQAEDYILFVESLLTRVNRSEVVPNLTSVSFHDQSVALAEAIEKLVSDLHKVEMVAEPEVLEASAAIAELAAEEMAAEEKTTESDTVIESDAAMEPSAEMKPDAVDEAEPKVEEDADAETEVSEAESKVDAEAKEEAEPAKVEETSEAVPKNTDEKVSDKTVSEEAVQPESE